MADDRRLAARARCVIFTSIRVVDFGYGGVESIALWYCCGGFNSEYGVSRLGVWFSKAGSRLG